jgi:hypothetical protein
MFRDLYAAPGEFALGSRESRDAARALLGRRNITTVIVMTGLPSPFRGQKPIITSSDTLTHYLALDESIVEVLCHEYEPGKIAAHVHQTWNDGGEYHGRRSVENLVDLQNLCRLPGNDMRLDLLYAKSQQVEESKCPVTHSPQ